MFILQLVVDKPGIYLREIQAELKDILEISIDVSAICKFLESLARNYKLLQHSVTNFYANSLQQTYLYFRVTCLYSLTKRVLTIETV